MFQLKSWIYTLEMGMIRSLFRLNSVISQESKKKFHCILNVSSKFVLWKLQVYFRVKVCIVEVTGIF